MQRSKSTAILRLIAVAIVCFTVASFVTLATAEGEGLTIAPAATANNMASDSAPVTDADQNVAGGPTAASSQNDVAPGNSSDNAATGPAGSQGVDSTSNSGVQPNAPAATAPPKKVGIQAGHWQIDQLPNELASLRTATGTAGGGVTEPQLSLDIANRAAALLQAQGIDVDVLPATVPPGYKADAFVALHADGETSGKRSGFKLARASWSAIPQTDDALLGFITGAYASATKLTIDTNVTTDMTQYYAFNNHALQHAIAPTTPGVILEMGYLTSASDRQVLLGTPETVAYGIARGIMLFLGTAN